MAIRVNNHTLAFTAALALVAFGSVATAGDQESSAVMAWGKLQMFERGGNGKLLHRTLDPDTKEWSKWEALADKEITSSPSALVSANDRLVVFFRGANGKLHHVYRDKETGWSEVFGLGTRDLSSGPTGVMVGEQLTVFARGTAGKQMWIYYDKAADSWTDWADVD